ncbi:hypothetical protein CN918_28125 [Priestia megaterium]|nr:hypothetical protein CN918_28125 [Priestia megaterium]
MKLLACIWLGLSLYILVRLVRDVYMKNFTWSSFVLRVQSPSIGLLIFPEYLGASQKIEWWCLGVGTAVLGFSFFFYLVQTGLMPLKFVIKKEDTNLKEPEKKSSRI